MKLLGIIYTLFLFCQSPMEQSSYEIVAQNAPTSDIFDQNPLIRANELYHDRQWEAALAIYEQLTDNSNIRQETIQKRIALCHAQLGNSEAAITAIKDYLVLDFDTSFLKHDGFMLIKDIPEFKELQTNYVPKISAMSIFYLYIAFVGFFIAFMISLNKNVEFGAKFLIASFIFIHSFFVFHISLNLTNYHLEFPHSYLMSTAFSFLYGPLIFFYFKRITQQYKFQKKDLLHLVPTLLFLFYIIPIYSMTAKEKLSVMLGRSISGYNSQDSQYVAIIVGLKLASLAVYGYFLHKLYRKGSLNNALSKTARIWQKNLYRIHILYIIFYAIYGVLISNHMASGFFYNMPIVAMALMIVYAGYSAYVQPDVFNGVYSLDNQLFFKYKKSGLTPSLSNELKEKLISLFHEDKIYKQNDISLEILAEKLNTNRHSASQVINEHFKMNFHELVNKYRILEAKKIIANDSQRLMK